MERANRHDMYPLKMYHYRDKKQSWRHVSRYDTPYGAPSRLRILTWNIDFQTERAEERAEAVLRYLEDVLADEHGEPPPPCCILLQEVSPQARDRIMDDEWVRANFYMTDSHKWRCKHYGNLTLVSRSIEVAAAKQLDFGWSNMQRSAIITDLKLKRPNSRQQAVIRIVNTHLESLPEGELPRTFQMAVCAETLKDGRVSGGVVAGDMNAISPGDEHLPQDNGLRDPWWRQDGSGNTWGYQGGGKFPKGRLDKILFLPNCGFRVSEPEKIGAGIKANGVYVSDHYGQIGRAHV